MNNDVTAWRELLSVAFYPPAYLPPPPLTYLPSCPATPAMPHHLLPHCHLPPATVPHLYRHHDSARNVVNGVVVVDVVIGGHSE